MSEPAENPYLAPAEADPPKRRGTTLADSRILRFVFFGLLYLAQGIPWGFLAGGYRVFLIDRGLSNEALGTVMGIAYLPWSFKVFYGPLLDRYRGGRFGRRRPFIILAEILMGLPLLALAAADPGRLGLINVLLFAHNTFAALQDLAVDGLAVDILPANETGRANSIMWAGKTLGVTLGSSGAVIAKHIGWQATFVAMTLPVWLIMIVPLLVRERPPSEDTRLGREGRRLDVPELVRTLKFPSTLAGFLIAFLAPAGFALVGTFTTRLYRKDLGLSEEALFLLNVIDAPAGIVGSLVGGALADRFGMHKAIAAGMAWIGGVMALFATLSGLWPRYGFLVAYQALLQIGICFYSAAALKFFMRLTNPAVGATQFTAYMAMTNLCYSFTARYGGWMADHLGYARAILIAAIVQVVTIPLLLLCDPKKAEARFRSDEKDAQTATRV
ncbi:MFS transporter [Polyangium sp. 15x6]|uniref:MFS transporter n=1 Tax=Polyangium sp. 15x6 TaxID=3042687 RepID=UPI00249C79DA|nr:MFS transporter [Polyangium sp. 15x6]MDI3283030.1 MFS transporter [Polyangium sp. 15x6]